jgi:phosphotransferase system HPr (HPr) family protein
MRSFAHVIADRLGLHARSCVVITHEAAKWASEVTVSLGDERADAKLVTPLMALHARQGDTLVVCCEGPDEAQAALALEALMRMSI